jgi:hypothetical protein
MAASVYLDAQERTQDLFTLKWTLRAAGVHVGSVWHDVDTPAVGAHQDRLSPEHLRELQSCDLLVVIAPANEPIRPEFAIFIGLALGSGMKVIWKGIPPPEFASLEGVCCAATLEEALQKILATAPSARLPAGHHLAAA